MGSFIGKDLKREYEFSGKQLIVKPASPDEHSRLVWEHCQDLVIIARKEF